MTEKQKEVIKAMQGMTYLEWVKLSHIINIKFGNEADKIKKGLEVASLEDFENDYNWLL